MIRKQLDETLMARTLYDLISSYIHDQSLTDLILSLVVIAKPEGSDDVYVRLVRISLPIWSDKTNMTFIPKQKGQLIVTDNIVRGPVLSSNADKLANAISVVKVRYFVDYFASLKVPLLNDKVQRNFITCFKNCQNRCVLADGCRLTILFILSIM